MVIRGYLIFGLQVPPFFRPFLVRNMFMYSKSDRSDRERIVDSFDDCF